MGGIGVNGTRAANELARAADVVLCVGTRLGDFTTASHSLFERPDVRFLGLNVASADAHKLGALPVVADARESLGALIDGLSASPWTTEAGYVAEARERRRRWEAVVGEDVAPRPGEGMTQGQALLELNAAARAGDWVVAAAGSPPGDLLKLWRAPAGSATHLEFAYSCMGHELPAGLGIRMAEPEAGEIYVVIGDGTYLMAPSELVTAAQEGLKVTVVLFVNGGYQSIHALQLGSTGASFGNEFRARRADGGRLDGDVVAVDYAASAASFGCSTMSVATVGDLRTALQAARAERGPVVIVCEVEPRRGLPGGGAWWDLGVAQVSELPDVRALAAHHAEGARTRRYYG
jgi:3D-(3,5/4)-trihydroxycyclohexane-1,2-dione acylhydrolase (decyclizing)